MNLKQLEAFVQVAEKKSFSKAAQAMFLTQPTVSAHISALEKEFHKRLIIRNTKGVELSADGNRFYDYAKQVVLMVEEMMQEFGNEKILGEQSLVKIAASTVPTSYLLPNILAKFRKSYPEEKIQIIEGDSASVIEQVALRNVDIGFTGTEIPNKYCEFVPFYEDDLILITPNTEHFLHKKEGADVLEWILKEPLILREEGSGTRKETEKILQKFGVSISELNVAAIVENPEAIKRSVSNGMGISILSALSASDAVVNGSVLGFSLGEMVGKRQIYVVYNHNFHLTPGAERILRIVDKWKRPYL